MTEVTLLFKIFNTFNHVFMFLIFCLFLYMVTINMQYFMVSRKSCWGEEQLSALKIYNNNK